MGQEGAIAPENGCLYVTLAADGTRHHAVLFAGVRIGADGFTDARGGFVAFNETVVFTQFGTPPADQAPADYIDHCGRDLPLFGVSR